MGSAASIARQLGAVRQGHNWRAPCPLGCGYALSLADGEDGRLLAYCFGGHSFDEIEPALVEYGLLDGDDGDLVAAERRVVRQHEDDAQKIAFARRLYAEAGGGALVANYLFEARGIALLPPSGLRQHLNCPHRLGIRLPAMVAPVVGIAGEFVGAHMTFLRPDGRAKAELPKEFQRECRGAVRGGAIRLGEHDPDRELVVAEGLETTLSAMQMFSLPGWAAVYGNNLKTTLMLPPAVRRVVIAADNDESGCGQRNAVEAARRWKAEGRAVRVWLPDIVGDDANSVLKRKRASG